MALSASDITGTQYTDSLFNNRNILKTGTVTSAPAASATTIRMTVPDADNRLETGANSREIGRYLFHRQTRNRVRITSVDAVSGEDNQFDIGLERPFDVSDFRAFEDASGNRFSESIPATDDNLGVSITMEDLFRASQRVDVSDTVLAGDLRTVEPESTANDNVVGNAKASFDSITINTPNSYVVQANVTLPADCLLVHEEGTIRGDELVEEFFTPDTKHSDASGMQFGRLHPGDHTDADSMFYTQGGVVILDGSRDSGTTSGASYQFVNCQYITTRDPGTGSSAALVFLRFYDGSSDSDYEAEGLQRIVMIDTILDGGIGLRVSGNKSFFRNVQYNDGAWRGLNFIARGDTNIFGYIENVAAYDSNALLYYYLTDSGANTDVFAPVVINPQDSVRYETQTTEACMVNVWHDGLTNSGSVNKVLNIYDIDWGAIKAIEEAQDNDEWRFIRNRNGDIGDISGSFTHILSRLNVECLDTNGDDFDDTPVKGFIHTTASGDQDDRVYDLAAVSDGQFATANIRMQSFQTGREFRLDATPSASGTDNVRYVFEDPDDSANNVPARVVIHARGYQPNRTSLLLQDYGIKTYRPTFLEDTEQSDVALTTIDAYEALETAQKLYDYSWKVLYNDPEAVAEDGQLDFFSKSGDTLTATGCDIEFSTSDFTVAEANNIFDAHLYYEQTTDDTDAIHVAIGSNAFTGNLVVDSDKDITFTTTIEGGAEADNINWTGTIPSTIIDTSEKIKGTIALTAGNTYTVTGGADISEVTFTKTGSGDDPIVILDDADTSVGSNNTTFTDVTATIRCTVSVTGLLSGVTFTDSDENSRAYSNDGTDYTSQTVGTRSAITDGYEFTVDYPDGDTLIVATSYEGYKVVSGSTSGTRLELTLESYTSTEFTAHALSATEQTFVDNSTLSSTSADGLDIDVPVTGITIDEQGCREILWTWMSSGNYLNGVCQEHFDADLLTFNTNGLVVDDTSDFNIVKTSSSSNIINFNIEVVDASGNNAKSAITSSDANFEVRLLDAATKVLVPQGVADTFVTNVGEEFDNRHLTAANVINLGDLAPVDTD